MRSVISHQIKIYEGAHLEIVALIDTSESEGSFFLATGNLSDSEYYKFYYLTDDGGKQFHKFPAQSVVIYEEERADAYLTKIGERKMFSEWMHFWFIPKFLCQEALNIHAIHVPNGTIKTGYEIDMK